MMYITISLMFYTILFFTDFLPMLKKKEKVYLRISLPVFFGTLILNLLIGLEVPYRSITSLLISLVTIFQK